MQLHKKQNNFVIEIKFLNANISVRLHSYTPFMKIKYYSVFMGFTILNIEIKLIVTLQQKNGGSNVFYIQSRIHVIRL